MNRLTELFKIIADPSYWEDSKIWRKNLMRVFRDCEKICLHQHICTICGLIWPCAEPGCSSDTTMCVMVDHKSEVPNSGKVWANVSIQLCSECWSKNEGSYQ